MIFKISVLSANIEVLYRFPDVDRSCYAFLTVMLLRHTPFDKNSWTPIHELLHRLSMLFNSIFVFPNGIFYWVSLLFDQIFKIGLPPGLFANPLIKKFLHLWFFYYWNLFLPLNIILIF
jgi:hypothetical protein